MSIRIVIKKNTYFGSISLMSISTHANKLNGVRRAFVAMATEMNKGVLKNFGLLTPELEKARSGDLMIVIKGTSGETNEQTLIAIDGLFAHKEQGGQHEAHYATIASAKKRAPESSLAMISINGLFVAREARQALQNNFNVMLFSDNVSLEDELELKYLARERELLVMGPDCGATTISGAVLCSDSAVRRDNIGIIGASGTGSQELSVCIHEFGGRISQLIGTGERGMSEKISGLMILDAISMLEANPQTEIITLISKPPTPAVTRKVPERAHTYHKPVVVCFLGRKSTPAGREGLQFARGTKGAALKAVLLTGVEKESLDLHPLNQQLIEEVHSRLTPQQKYIRDLFCGSTLCDGAMLTAMKKLSDVYSNIHPNPAFRLADPDRSMAHTFLDSGDDYFTNDEPYPTIDPTNRIIRLLQEAQDPEVGVIVMDFVLGFGLHGDPIGAMLNTIIEAEEIATADGHPFEILGYVLGTDLDIPSLKKQYQMLANAGVIWTGSSTNTGLLTCEFVFKEGEG